MRNRLVVLLLLCSMLANAQVWNGNLNFRSQSEIDDFANFSYTTVTGSVTINDGQDGEHDIRNLAGLAGLSQVSLTLTVTNCNLLTNTAFLNVTTAGEVQIVNNPALTTLNGLPLTAVLGGINITNNASLTTITAFSALTEIPEFLVIRDNPLLTNLGGFNNLQKTKTLNVGNNNSLTQLDAFSNLAEVSTLTLINLPALGNINGLNSLATASNFRIANCAALTNVNGLSNLSTVEIFSISNNASLQNVDGLSGMSGSTGMIISNCSLLQSIRGSAGISGVYLKVEENPALKTISGFTNALTATLEISHNYALETMTGFDKVERAGINFAENWALKTINIFPRVHYLSQFFFDRNYLADNISPMPLLDTVFNDFTLLSDTMLTSLDFVPGLRYVGGTFRMANTNNLKSIEGLSNLDSVGGDIVISLFDAPVTNALSKIEYISGTLDLGTGPEVENLAGLRNLKKVGTNLLIGGLGKVTNLDDLVKLESVGGVLLIQAIPKLTNLNGLRNLRNAQNVYVRNNAVLSNFCGLYGLFFETPPAGVVEISGNQVNPTASDIRNDGPCSTLPVHFLVFNLRCTNNQIQLSWVTANEVNNSHFIVQRSGNGNTWTDLGLVPAAGNNGGVTKYAFSDDQPPASAYYRLAQVDLDRKIHYSSVIRAACTVDMRYNVWPNPATSKVLVSIPANNSSSGVLKLADSKGSIIQSKNIILFPGQNQVEINISDLPKGLYFLQVIYKGNRPSDRTVLLKN